MTNILFTVQLPQVIAQHTFNATTSKRCNNFVPFSIFLALRSEGVEKGIFLYPKFLNLIYGLCKSGTKKYLAANQVKKEIKKFFDTSIVTQIPALVKSFYSVTFFSTQTTLFL